MSVQPPRAKRPPLTVLFALVLMTPIPISLGYGATRDLVDADLVTGLGSVVALVLWAVLVSRLWAGGRIAYVVAVVLAALNLLVGLAHLLIRLAQLATLDGWSDTALRVTQTVFSAAILLLLLAAPSSRAFFARRPAAT